MRVTAPTSEFKRTIARLLDRVTPVARDSGRDIWSVCGETVAQVPPKLRDQMAVEFLVNAYFDDLRHCGEPAATKTPAKVKKPKRERVPLSEMQQAELDEALSKIDRRFWASMHSAMDEFKASLFDEWTTELLAARFTLEDGTSVTWAAATRNQHRMASIAHQVESADALKQAARHEAAIDLIDKSGAECLAFALNSGADLNSDVA